MRSFFYNLDKVTEEARRKGDLNLFDFCKGVKRFVVIGEYSTYKRIDDLMKLWGTTDKVAASRMGITESTVRVTRRKISNQLYELLGYDFFHLIGDGSKEGLREASYRILMAKSGLNSRDFLYGEMFEDIGCLPLDEGATYSLEDCRLELDFLLSHSKQSIRKGLESLDKDKLAYIIGLLDNKAGTPNKVYEVVKMFEKGGK